jgi:hypothetical protein
MTFLHDTCLHNFIPSPHAISCNLATFPHMSKLNLTPSMAVVENLIIILQVATLLIDYMDNFESICHQLINNLSKITSHVQFLVTATS